MILIYEFTYVSNNGVLENFLEDIARKSDIERYITKEGDKISLHTKGDEEELENFSKKLSNSLPYSIFLKSANVYVGDEWNENDACKMQKCDIYLPFTKKALEISEADFNPFVKNEVGLSGEFDAPLILEINKKCKKYYDNFKEAFESAADIVNDGDKLEIKTSSGIFCVSKIEDRYYGGETIFIPTDLSAADKIAVLKNEDIIAIASLEKPMINVHTNLIFASKYPKVSRFIKLAMADNLFLHFLSVSLFKKGVNFITLEQKSGGVSGSLYFEQDISYRQRLEVCALGNGQNIVVNGKGHINPQDIQSVKFLQNPHHTQFAATMRELKLFDKANCGIYLSLKNDDMIMFYDDKVGVLDILNVEFADSFKEIFEKIKSEDEQGGRLFENYKKNFGDIVQKIENITFENIPKSLSSLWGIAALLGGFGDDFDAAKRKLFENIEIFGGEKGPRIDYKLTDEQSAKTSLNSYKLLRSVMSFKLAEIDNEILSYGIAESLVYFLSDFTDRLSGGLKADNILLMGSFFSSKTISNLCVKHLSPNHKVCFNRELPIEL